MRIVSTLLLAFLGVIIACAPTTKPDLERLYAGSRNRGGQPPVVLIPGLMGTKLRHRDTQEEIWPASQLGMLFRNYSDLALAIDPRTLLPTPSPLEPFAITEQAAGIDFYATILRTLETAGGYRYALPGTPVQGSLPRYYIFLYDWRNDNVQTVRRLSRFIEQIRLDHGDPDLQMDIIGHSMGGLIARYYLRYGEQDVLDDNEFPVNMHGRSRIRRMILLGTPNLGSVEALKSFIAGRTIGLKRIPNEVLMTMPSLYQLFPHALHDWLIKADGESLERDQFDVEIWRRFQWSVFDPVVRSRIAQTSSDPAATAARLRLLERYFEKHLERARRFVWSLTVPVPDPVPLIVFGGDCDLTPARLLVEEVAGESMLRLWPREVSRPVPGIDYGRLMLEPGDGLVTKASLLGRTDLDPSIPRHRYSFFPLDYSFFLCEEHDTLPANPSFLDNLLHALLSRDRRF